ncbi:MAG: type II secretion system F family protein [Tyzzerella sp.]|nr:type II secretion system F family protein [Tyzzerella sp.]
MKYKRERNYWQQDIHKREYLKAVLQGILLIGTVSYLFYGTVLGAILLSPYLIWYLKSWQKEMIKKKRQSFRTQFKEAIQSLSAALSVGYSVENAMREAVKDLKNIYKKEELILRELAFMIRQLQMNMTAENVLQEFAARTGDEDVQTFVTVFAMAKRSGGDTLEIIRNAVRQMSEKIEVEREIVTIMSAKKLEFRIMTAIPFAMILYLKISFPEFLDVLYGNIFGIIVMTVCLFIYLIAYEGGRRIVEIEV